jgi:uncharacterized protein (DUF4213/DUF364 family)
LEEKPVIPVFYETLLRELPDRELRVDRIVRGVAWTAAVLSNGQAGVAMHTLGESRPRMFPTLIGLPAGEAARAVLSWNFEEAGEGMAVLNACYNTAARIETTGCRYTGSSLEGIPLSGRRVGFVGHLLHHGGLTEELVAQAESYFILEREPKEGDYPDSACEYLLPGCDVAVITGSACVNKTMPRLLELAKGAQIVLTGPTVPLCPVLLDLGISRLNGSVITDRDGMLDKIVRERCSVNAFSSHFTLGD